jgi:hypothetical protein
MENARSFMQITKRKVPLVSDTIPTKSRGKLNYIKINSHSQLKFIGCE